MVVNVFFCKFDNLNKYNYIIFIPVKNQYISHALRHAQNFNAYTNSLNLLNTFSVTHGKNHIFVRLPESHCSV